MKRKNLDLELEHHFKMKKFFIIIFFFLNISYAYSEVKISYIDINFIVNNSNVGKSLNEYLNSLKNKHFEKFNKIEDELKKKEGDLISKKNIVEKTEFEKKAKFLQDEIKKYKLDRKKSNDEINKNKIDNTKKILLFLDPIVKKYVDENSISLVLPKKNIIVGKKNLDITNDIINILNEKVDKINF